MYAVAVKSAKVISRVAGGVVLLIGSMGVAGWIWEMPALKSALAGNVTIKANAAIGLMLLGSGLLLVGVEGRAFVDERRGRVARRVGRAFGGIAMALALATLLQHLTGVDLGIDQLLFVEPPGALATSSPGRMGIPACVSFTLAGMGLILSGRRLRGGIVPTQWLGIAVGLVAALPLIGYAYGMPALYGVSMYTGIALHTAVAILLLGLGLLTLRPTWGLMAVICGNDAGGAVARRMVLPAVLIPFLLGWIRTVGERYNLVDATFGRSMLVLSLIVSFTAVVWWTARSMSRLDRARRRGEEALKDSEELLRLGLEAGRTGLWDFDVRSNRIQWTGLIYEFHGMKPGEFDGTLETFMKFVHPEDLARVEQGMRAALEHDAPYQVELRVVRPDGSVRWLSTSGKVYRNEGGNAVRMLGATTDVTARKEAEAERERLLASERATRAEAERASEAKSEFLATLSHELRTPLTPVLLTVSLMESHHRLPEELREAVAEIRRNIELESLLISDLLDLTRVTSGKLHLEMQAVDVHEVVRSALEICRREPSPTVRVDLAAKRHVVMGDATRLNQVFWNLLNNALKFTPLGGTITVRSEDVDAHRVRVLVADNGIGIDAGVLPKLFNAFEQGEIRQSRKHAGLGLGLAISRKLAEAHGGTITAWSEGRDMGATFAVDLPVVVGVEAVTPAAVRGSGNGSATRPMRILLVEDHEGTLTVMKKLLKMLGHEVMGVSTVAAAVAAVEGETFDCVISDLGLPDGSGLELMRRIAGTYTGRAIALSGYGMESDVAASLKAGFSEHLTKPVDLATLEEAILRVSGRAGDRV